MFVRGIQQFLPQATGSARSSALCISESAQESLFDCSMARNPGCCDACQKFETEGVSSNRGSQQAEAMSFSEHYRGSQQYRQSLLMQLPPGSQALGPSSSGEPLASESQQAESRLPVQWRAGYSRQSLLMKSPPQAHTSPTKRHKFSKSTFHSNFS